MNSNEKAVTNKTLRILPGVVNCGHPVVYVDSIACSCAGGYDGRGRGRGTSGGVAVALWWALLEQGPGH